MTFYALGTPESLPANLRDEEGNVYPVQPMTGAPIPGGATQSTFVFQPGGVAAGNVFTSWAALYAAFNLACPASTKGTRSPSTIRIDDSFTSPATIPAGAYNLDGVTFDGVSNEVAASGGAQLTIAAGATFILPTPGLTLRFRGALGLTYAGAVPCIVNGGATQETNVFLSEDCILLCSGAGSFLSVTNGFCYVQAQEGSQLGDGVHAVITNAAPGTTFVQTLANGLCLAGAVIGAGATVFWDSNVPGAQGAGVTVTQVDGYVPTTPADWPAPAPTKQNVALDTIAAVAVNHNQQTSAVAGPANPLDSAALAFTPSGSLRTRMHVSTTCSSAAADDLIQAALLGDGAVFVGAPTPQATATLVGDKVTLTIEWIVTTTAGAHTVAVRATSGAAANLTGTQQVVSYQALLS